MDVLAQKRRIQYCTYLHLYKTFKSQKEFFLEINLLYCHMKSETCFQSKEGSCIDLILSNKKYGLQKTDTLDTGLSDFHHLFYTQLKIKFTKIYKSLFS